MDDAGTEYERGWLRIENGLVAELGPGDPPSFRPAPVSDASRSDVAGSDRTSAIAPPEGGEEPPATRGDRARDATAGARDSTESGSDNSSTAVPNGQGGDEVRDLRGAVVTPGPDQHAPPPLPDPHARAGAGGRPLHLAAHALPDLGAHRRRDGVRRRAHRARRAGAVRVQHGVRPPLRLPARRLRARRGRAAAARELGVRMVASRGSMDLGASDGGLPPDELAEDMDAILADTERLAALADGDMVRSRGRALLAVLGHDPTDGGVGRARAPARASAPHAPRRDGRGGGVLQGSSTGARRSSTSRGVGWLDGDVWCAHCVHLSAGRGAASPNTASASRTAPRRTSASAPAPRRCATCSTRARASASASTARRRTSAATCASR